VGPTIVVLAGLAYLTGCSSRGAVSPTPADTAYLSEVHDDQPQIGTYRTDVELVRLGHAACDDFAAGANYPQVADRLATEQVSHSLPSASLGTVIMAAADNYCPQFKNRV
jgi:hypothetical protein